MHYHNTMMPLKDFERYHPLFVEGMGGYDTRDPARVANTVAASVIAHWKQHPPSKPPLLIIQGDPLETKGISAITPHVASILELHRGLIVLDADLADYHSSNADRDNVILEAHYSDAVTRLESLKPGSLAQIESAVNILLIEKNQQRSSLNRSPLADYYQIFACLQEVSKASLAAVCGEMTLAHTTPIIDQFSVTSFYQVGMALGFLPAESVVAFRANMVLADAPSQRSFDL
jgi:hypothetical protein